MRGIFRAAAAILLVFILFSITAAAAKATENDKIQYLPDGQGGFYILQCRTNEFRLMLTDPNNSTRTVMTGSTKLMYFTVSGELVVLVAEKMNSQPVIVAKSGRNPQTIFLSDTELADGLVAADVHYNVYAVDSRERRFIRKFSDTGELIEKISAGFDVQALFSCGNELYAAGNGKCMSLLQGITVSTTVPAGRFIMSGNYTCGTDGTVYSFSGGIFSPICRCSTPVCCASYGEIFSARGSVLYKNDTNGNTISSYDTGSPITAIYASGTKVACVSSGELNIADLSKLKKTEDETPPESRIHDESRNTDDSSKDAPDNSFSLSSEKYDLSGDEIIIDSGTTVAAFRSDISLSGGSAQFYDTDEKTTTSGQLGSGCSVCFTGGGIQRRYRFIVKGDLTGEGNINSRDETTLCAVLLGEKSTDEIILSAADMNGNRAADAGDLVLLRKMLGKSPGTESSSGEVQLSLSTDAAAAGKAFYVYADFSAAPVSAVLSELSYDNSHLHLTSAKLTDGSGTDSFRYYDAGGKVSLLLTGGVNGKRAALRFEFQDNSPYSGTLEAVLSAYDSDGNSLRSEKILPLNISTSAAPEKSSSEGKTEASSKTKTSSKTAKEKNTTSKEKSSSVSDEETATTESDSDIIEYTIPGFDEPVDESKRNMLIAGVILLAIAAGIAGYQIAQVRKERKK